MQPVSRISEYEKQLEAAGQRGQEWVTEMVDAQPLASLCTVFAAGFVLGVGAVVTVAGTRPQPRSRASQFEALSDRIAETVSQALPRQLSDLWSRYGS